MHAKSLLTQVVVTNMEKVERITPARGYMIAGESSLCELVLKEPAEGSTEQGGPCITSEAILIPNPTGLHAWLAAVLANLAKKYVSTIQVQRDERLGNVKSVTDVMKLNIAQGGKVVLLAKGVDSEEAIAVLVAELQFGLGDEGCIPSSVPATTEVSEQVAPARRQHPDDPNVLIGVSASPGFAPDGVQGACCVLRLCAPTRRSALPARRLNTLFTVTDFPAVKFARPVRRLPRGRAPMC